MELESYQLFLRRIKVMVHYAGNYKERLIQNYRKSIYIIQTEQFIRNVWGRSRVNNRYGRVKVYLLFSEVL